MRRSFNISVSGVWPRELYVITPNDYNDNILALSSIPSENLFRFVNNPTNDINILADKYKQIDYSFGNSTYNVDNDNSLYKLSSNTNNNTFIWNISSLRSFNIGPIFNYFANNFTTNLFKTTKPINSLNLDIRAYSLYPQRLHLIPVSAVANANGTFTLVTSAVFLSATTFFFNSPSAEYEAFQNHLRYRNSLPTIIPIRGNSSPINLYYSISATKNVIFNPLFKWSDDFNPISVNSRLEPSGVNIRPDSTFIKYANKVGFNEIVSTIGQEYVDETPYLNRGFRSSFIQNFNLRNNPNYQTFQLIQSTVNLNVQLEDISNAILTTVIDINNNSLKYDSLYYLDQGNRPVNVLTGVDGKSLQARYIADSPLFFNSSTRAITGVVTNVSLNTPIANSSNPYDRVTWTVPYPLYYYSFKTSFTSPDFTNPVGTSNLNFNLSSWVTTSTTSSIYISSVLVSDFNSIVLDLPTYAPYDYIALDIVDDVVDTNLLSAIYCFYGPNANISYDLFKSPFVPIFGLSGFRIIYPDTKYGQFDLTFRTRLSSSQFNFVTDSPEAKYTKIAEGQVQKNAGYKIFFNLLDQKQDRIILDISQLTSFPSFPARDLTNSFISWSYTNSTPQSSYIKLYSVDSEYNLISFIPNNSAIPFDSNTWRIAVSGYGPTTTTITLSSQKYNETATVNTDPRLFDYLSEKKFIIGPSKISPAQTTNITLTAAVPVNNILYPIPSYIPIYWTWSYNNSGNQFINAEYINGTPYEYGKNDFAYNLSSINTFINLNASKNSFDRRDIKFSLISHYNSNIVEGNYTINLQDYPDSSIFNCDFKTSNFTYYSIIADTRIGKNVITRSKSDLNYYSFYANTDVLPKISASRFQWTISDNTGYIQTLSSTVFNVISSLSYKVTNNNARITTVTLSAIDARIAGWTVPHDISSTTTIYTLPSAEFNNPLQFRVFPPYTWIQGNSGYITLLDQNNYTLAYAPTAYANKISNSQAFYLSANKSFKEYNYTVGVSQSAIETPQTSAISLIDIPYSNNFFSNTGLLISLSGFSDIFPKINGLNYLSVDTSNNVYTGYYNITANTLPFTGITNSSQAFIQSPKLIPYETMNLKFSTVDTSLVFDYNEVTQLKVSFTPVTSIDLDNNVFIGVIQTIFPPNTANSPVRLLEDYYSGTITYSISTAFWQAKRHVPAVNGIFDLFTLAIGDATQLYTVSQYKFNTLKLSASANFKAYIPPSTFDLYPPSAYGGNPNLWSSFTQTSTATTNTIVVYSTSVKPEIYLSNYYGLTGSNFKIQFNTPENSENLSITSYNIYFGDGNSQTHLIDDIIYYSYDKQGVYTLSYDVNYNNGTTDTFQLAQNPITVYDFWPYYDQSDIRILTQTSITLPWSLDQIYIQPNEFAVSDIFNTSILRIYDCLDYLNTQIQTINTDAPSFYYGWLGCNSSDLSKGIQWHTPNYNSIYQTTVQNATSVGLLYFKDIKDIYETQDYFYVLDGTNFRVFSAQDTFKEIIFDNMSQIKNLIVNPVSFDIDPKTNSAYIADSFKNKVYKLNLNFDYINEINIQLQVGNFGGRQDPNKFNSPTEVTFVESNVFVLDYNNICLKQYTEDLNWIYTYYTEDFENDRPLYFTIHPTTILPYIISQKYYIYTFDHMGHMINKFLLTEVRNSGNKIVKIIFDENGDFFYVLTVKDIFKYSAVGTFISRLSIPSSDLISYTSAKYSSNRTLLFSTKNSVIKCQDIVSLFKVGQGLPYNFWSREQCMIYDDEFVTDIPYNRSLTRMVQNIKGFRDIFDSRFVIASEQTSYGTVEYFAKTPIGVGERPRFSDDIENETVEVGINEFNIPQVINRELEKIYTALLSIASYLSITDVRLLSSVNTGCSEPFCWSWKSMSCYNLSLPVIRICNINPITYAELETNYPSDYVYAPSKNWGNATSDCCNQIASPLG